MKRFLFFLLFLVLISTTYISCVKQKLFPPEPSIEFKQFNKFDTVQNGTGITYLAKAECIIKFKDGDGDIGIVKGDATSAPDLKMVYFGPRYDTITSQYITSDLVPYNDSAFNLHAKFDTLTYWYRVPDITPQGQYKALEGEILIKMTVPFAVPFHSVFKFGIALTDRAGHMSNWVYTDVISNTP